MVAVVKPAFKCPVDLAVPTGDRTRPQDAVPVPMTRQGCVMPCPACARRLRWQKDGPGRGTCPNCGSHLVFLVYRPGVFVVRREDEDAIEELICDWLDSENENEAENDGD